MTGVLDREAVADDRRPSAGPLLAAAAVTSVLLGALTAYAQGWLPEEVGSLANSAAPWCAVAFLFGLRARRPSLAAVSGLVALAALVAGYYGTSQLRGLGVSPRAVAFWVVAALVAGPVLGLAAHLVSTGRPVHVAVALGLPVGLLLGEGAYGLTVVADTTYPPYWWFEVVAGTALLALVAVARLRRPALVALAAGAAAVVAVAVRAVLTGDLLALL